jgi:hypothetical protein
MKNIPGTNTSPPKQRGVFAANQPTQSHSSLYRADNEQSKAEESTDIKHLPACLNTLAHAHARNGPLLD